MADLENDGVISDAEFEQAKAKVIACTAVRASSGRSQTAASPPTSGLNHDRPISG